MVPFFLLRGGGEISPWCRSHSTMVPLALHHGGVLTSPWWSFSGTMVKLFLHRGVFSRAPKRAIPWTALQLQCKGTKFFTNRQIGLFCPNCPVCEIYAKNADVSATLAPRLKGRCIRLARSSSEACRNASSSTDWSKRSPRLSPINHPTNPGRPACA